MHLQFFRLFSLFILLYSSCISAKQHNVQVRQFGVEEGLSSRVIYSFFQDQQGFIWIGTDYGLNRFDGHQFKVYTKEEHGFSDNRIRKVIDDQEGNIWISLSSRNFSQSQEGNTIDIFNPITEKNTKLLDWLSNPQLIKGERIRDMFLAENNKIYLLTYSGAIYQCTNKQLIKLAQFPQEEPIDEVQTGINGVVWVLTSRAIYQVNQDNGIQKIKSIHGSSSRYDYFTSSTSPAFIDYTYAKNRSTVTREVRRLYTSGHDSLLYTISAEYTCVFIDPSQLRAGVIHNESHTFGMLGFEQNPKGEFDSWGVKIHARYEGLHHLVDRQGGLWVDNPPNGIARIQVLKKHFDRYIYQRPVSSSATTAIRAIALLDTNQLIAASYLEMHRLDLSKNKLSKLPLEYEGKKIAAAFRSILPQADQVLIGASDGQLLRYSVKKNRIEHIYRYSPHSDSSFSYNKNILAHWALFEDSHGTIWLGHEHGISYLNQADSTLYPYLKINNFHTIREKFVYQFHENDQGIWVVSASGLYLLDPEKGIIDRYHSDGDQAHHLPHNQLHHLHEDNEGYFWLASKGGGLIKWHPKTKEAEQFTVKDGLSHNVLYAVYEDDFNNLWLSSNRGIMRFERKSHFVATYLTEDGITHEEFNRISHYQAKDGRIFFGGLDGITAFHPKDFQFSSNPSTPLVPKITSFSVQNNKTGAWENKTETLIKSNSILLKPESLGFKLQFAHLDFKNIKKQQYAYLIDGFDKSWNYQKSNTLRINKLPYGFYKLRIKSQESSGIWGNELVLDIEVQKPIYLRTWFLVLAALFGLFIFWQILRWRVARLENNKKRLQLEVWKRTQQIEKDKEIILKQTEELTKLDQLKSRFFTNISHELRTPLTLILGPAKHAIKNYNSLNKENIIDTFKLIKNNGQHLLQLVEEILELSRLEAQQIQINYQAINLGKLLARIYDNFESQATYLGIEYELVNWPQEQAILLDQNKFEKILNNLIGNALKFTSKGQQIRVIAKPLYHKRLQVKVIDTGKGIHPDDLPHLFERFYQSKQINGVEQGGTGIGLALAKELTEIMGGQLTVESVLGKGSEFTLSLPLIPTSEVPINGVSSHQELEIHETVQNQLDTPSTNVGRLLIVEDNINMQQFIVSLLQIEYQLYTARNGKEALAVLADPNIRIDLIISDVMMPEMDGFTLLSRIKASDKWSGIPVIMLTARAAEEDRLNALRIGVDDYLTKPFSTDELKAHIQNLLHNYRKRISWQEHTQSTPVQSTIDDHTQNNEVDQKWLENLEQVMKKNLGHHHLTMEDIAEYMHISKRQLARKLKQLTGLSPLKYQREIQLQLGRQWLEKGTYATVAEVAYKAGFKNPHYFSQQYRERFGKKPGTYFRSN